MTAITWPLRGERTRSDTTSSIWSAVAVSVLAGFFALLALAGFHSVLVNGQHGIDRLQDRLDAGREQAQVLRMEVARLESPDRILEVAQGRLRMVPPPARVYLASVVPGDPRDPVPAPSANPFSRTRP